MGRDQDLNEARRLQAVQAEAARGPLIKDRFGRPLVVGAEVEFHDPLPVVFVIVEMKPDLRPNAQPGVWFVTLAAQLQMLAQNGQRMTKATVVMMPDPTAAEQPSGDPDNVGDPGDPAASDTPAAPPSSIILTDMDRTANETLTAAKEAEAAVGAKSALRLVPDQPIDPEAPPAPAEPPAAIPEIDHGGEI